LAEARPAGRKKPGTGPSLTGGRKKKNKSRQRKGLCIKVSCQCYTQLVRNASSLSRPSAGWRDKLLVEHWFGLVGPLGGHGLKGRLTFC
jgi:hypothetical protein